MIISFSIKLLAHDLAYFGHPRLSAKVRTWFASAANKLDAAGLFVFVVGLILRFIEYDQLGQVAEQVFSK